MMPLSDSLLSMADKWSSLEDRPFYYFIGWPRILLSADLISLLWSRFWITWAVIVYYLFWPVTQKIWGIAPYVFVPGWPYLLSSRSSPTTAWSTLKAIWGTISLAPWSLSPGSMPISCRSLAKILSKRTLLTDCSKGLDLCFYLPN